jgi:uncharacterized DUF497 family protein
LTSADKLVKYQLSVEVKIVPRMTRPKAASQLRHCLEHGEVIPTRHFRDQLADEEISFQDAHDVLRRGIIYDESEEDSDTQEWKYRIEGHEPGGKWMAIIYSFKTTERASLITIFSIHSRRRRS